MFSREHADKVGIPAAIFASLCCLGIPVVLSALSTLGLAFLIHDAFLAPLLVGSLALALWGLVAGWRRHRRPAALILGGVAAVGLVAFSLVSPSQPFAYMSIAALIGSSALNVVWLHR